MSGERIKRRIQKILGWVYVITYFRHIYFPTSCRSISANMLVLSHRNGAIDAFVYYYAIKKGVFLVAKQLQRNFFLKFIFPGISVYRKKDKKDASSSNRSAIMECLMVLKDKQEPLCIFPEGTSTLGPNHLPFFDGYAKMALANAKSEGKTTLLPVAVFYDDPTHLGGSVWIVPCPEVTVSSKMSLPLIQKRTLENFENVFLAYSSEKNQSAAHQAAVIATLTKKTDYYTALKTIGQRRGIISLVNTYNQKMCGFRYKQTIIYPQNFGQSLWVFLITLPIVIPALFINIIPILVGYFAGRTRRDDPNTISLWRALTGYPVAVLFHLILFMVSPLIELIILPLSIWGFHLYGAFKKHLYALLNFIFCHSGYADFKEIQDAILAKL